MAGPAAAPEALFEAVIVPHRSISRRGVLYVVALVSASSSLITLMSWGIGAWPIICFNSAEIPFALLLLHWHARRLEREREVLLLRENGLTVTRSHRRGRSEVKTLPVQWLNVVLEERQGRVPALLLVSRGIREEVARSLGEAEKRDLAAALAAAFERMRHPVFDNPQLADPPRYPA